jgi:hypothetical protein
MLKKQEIEDQNSCWNKAEENERVFILLARDPAAETAIRAWVDARIRLGINQPSDAQINEALTCATMMKSEGLQRARRGLERN